MWFTYDKVSYVKIREYDSKNIIRMIRMLELWSMKRYGVRPSVLRLSVRPFQQQTRPVWWSEDIDRCCSSSGVRRVNAGRATLTAYVGSWTETFLFCKLTSLLICAAYFICSCLLQSHFSNVLSTSLIRVLGWWLMILTYFSSVHSVLWRCWLGGRKGIRPVKNWLVGCWHGYLSGARCRLAYGPADATATHYLLLQ